MRNLIYLDNAATSFPKPQSVALAVGDSFNRCANPGRAGHPLSMYSLKAVHSCREMICSFFNYKNPENVVFTYNTTYALNMAINSFAKKNTEIIISNLEHNSVLRSVYAKTLDDSKCVMKVFDASLSDKETIESFVNSITDKTSLAVVTMASNVTGKILPYREISKICKEKGISLIFDAAQLAGLQPLDLEDLYFDAVCFAGHKSLYGIMGTGFCIFSSNTTPKPLVYGGNGVESLSYLQTGLLPERLEAGTLGVPGIIALREGIRYIKRTGLDYIENKNRQLDGYLKEQLANIDGVIVYGVCDNKVPITLFNLENTGCEEVSQKLSSKGICVRAGYHCSPLAHRTLGTLSTGGIRVSLSHNNTKKDIDALVKEIVCLAK